MDLEKLSLTNLLLIKFLREELKRDSDLNNSVIIGILLRMQWLVSLELLKEDIPEISETVLYKNLTTFHDKVYPELRVEVDNELIERLKMLAKVISNNCKKRRDIDETNELNCNKEAREVISKFYK